MAQGYVPSPEERKLLLEMAKQDIRAPHEQLRYLIVSKAARRGMLPQTNSNPSGQVLADATGIAR